ncbi:PEP-CTERM sorting domain-containing protein [Thiorhodococcus mannitoliphagus]|uniref:PEP-CTERM sorting domain-containing protein n=1 Tax=Thiorhodococcus mannitoliphagus TaxID=329406 RepID=A0A6P1DQK8_9GAMM|nr:PEP-CTERM sorting domain-containing protein [Thiorhodococcus mannitoliphagus]NEX18956.1 PEP-CTERM sorting domain-containing protein [Thiorhodococcus mannitoliphagus]
MKHLMKTPAVVVGLITMSPIASATLLLDVDFEDALSTYLYETTTGGDSSSAAMNIRPASDDINTKKAGGFDHFFDSKFLVIGDEEGGLGLNPNGTNQGALTRIDFQTELLSAGSYNLKISFDYVFDTNLNPTDNPGVSPDDFSVRLFGGNSYADLLSFGSVVRNSTSRRGQYSELRTFDLSGDSPIYLSFALTEYRGLGSSAVGLDNLQITNVPLPGTLILVGAGLAGLGSSGTIGRRRSSSAVKQRA